LGEDSRDSLDILQGLLENAIAEKGWILKILPGINGSFTASLDSIDEEFTEGVIYPSSITNDPAINCARATICAYLVMLSHYA